MQGLLRLWLVIIIGLLTTTQAAGTCIKHYESGDEEGIPAWWWHYSGSFGPNSSEELLDSEVDRLGGDNISFWSLPYVNESSCRIMHIRTDNHSNQLGS